MLCLSALCATTGSTGACLIASLYIQSPRTQRELCQSQDDYFGMTSVATVLVSVSDTRLKSCACLTCQRWSDGSLSGRSVAWE